jgi:hypothetical protein
LISLGLVAVGFGVTLAIDRLGGVVGNGVQQEQP